MALKGRSHNKQANEMIMDFLVCKHGNISFHKFKRMPYYEKEKQRLIIGTIMNVKPELLMR